MKDTSTKNETFDRSMGTYDPELDKFVDVDLFPEKTAKAKAILEKYPIPAHLLKRSTK